LFSQIRRDAREAFLKGEAQQNSNKVERVDPPPQKIRMESGGRQAGEQRMDPGRAADRERDVVLAPGPAGVCKFISHIQLNFCFTFSM